MAKKAKNSIAAALILQFLSIANSFKADNKDVDNDSRSMTLVISSKCLKRATLTSDDSSFNKDRKIGKILSVVIFFPTIGARPKNESAKATRTC